MSRDFHADQELLRDDLAAYALGGLGGAEEAELERHLERCDACREMVRWLRPAVDLLSGTVEQRTPPASLRESLMTTVRAEAAESAPVSTTRETGSERREPWWRGLTNVMLRPATGMVVLIVLVAGVAGGYLLRGEGEVPGSEFIKGVPASGAVEVSATLERHGDSGTLHVNQLPELARDEVYQVWVQRAGVMEPRSTFVLGGDGAAEAAVPGPLDGAEAVLVTAEPRPGSPRPTSPPILEAPLQ